MSHPILPLHYSSWPPTLHMVSFHLCSTPVWVPYYAEGPGRYAMQHFFTHSAGHIHAICSLSYTCAAVQFQACTATTHCQADKLSSVLCCAVLCCAVLCCAVLCCAGRQVLTDRQMVLQVLRGRRVQVVQQPRIRLLICWYAFIFISG